MDVNNELKDTISESRLAKAKKDKWVSEARSKASSHGMKRALWIILIIALLVGIVGMYVDALSIVSQYVSLVFGWIGLADYTLYISIALIIVGVIRFGYHTEKKNQQSAKADRFESMALSSFRRKYM